VPTTQLDRRRDQATAAHTAVQQTTAAVTELENRLRTNADFTRQQAQALRNAEAETKRLRRSLKTQERDRSRLKKAHQKAVAKARKAQSRADAIEAKYSKTVLSDLVLRAKEQDRTASTPAAPAEPVIDVVVAAEPVAVVVAEPVPAAEPAPARPARATAARATAAKAAAAGSTRSNGRATTARKTAASETSTAAKRTPARRAR
jgi:hypothetical protein